MKHDTQDHSVMEALLRDDVLEVVCQGSSFTTCRFSRQGLHRLQVVSKVRKCKWVLHADSLDENIPRSEWTSWELMVALHGRAGPSVCFPGTSAARGCFHIKVVRK